MHTESGEIFSPRWNHNANSFQQTQPVAQLLAVAPPICFSFQHAKYFDRSSIFTPLRLALIDFHGVRWSGRACVGQWKEGAHWGEDLSWQRLSPCGIYTHTHACTQRGHPTQLEASFNYNGIWIYKWINMHYNKCTPVSFSVIAWVLTHTHTDTQTEMQSKKCNSDCAKANSYRQVHKYHHKLDTHAHSEWTHTPRYSTNRL